MGFYIKLEERVSLSVYILLQVFESRGYVYYSFYCFYGRIQIFSWRMDGDVGGGRGYGFFLDLERGVFVVFGV